VFNPPSAVNSAIVETWKNGEKEAEDLLQSQLELHGRIARITENLRKLGQANITAGAVQSRMITLDGYWSKFEEQHELLRSRHADAIKNLDYIKKDYLGTVEESYQVQKGVLLDYLSRINPASQATSSTSARTSPLPRNTLPRIQLPSFAGRYEDWPAFRDLFQSIVGNDNSLSNVEKLHYLKVSLKAEAECLIKNLPTTAENYSRAWKLLTDQYENKRLLVRSCLAKFALLQKMKTESASELRKIINGASSTAGTLESIGRPVSTSEDLFVFFITELLDTRTRREWENSISNSSEPPTFSALKSYLERRLQTLTIVQPSKADAPPHKASDGGNRSARNHHAQKRESSAPARCGLCKKDHLLMLCDDYKKRSAAERKRFVDTELLCGNCLGKHTISNCASKKLCAVCGEKHHTSLHDAFRKAPVEANVGRAALSAYNASRRSSVLLATARVTVSDRFGNPQDARALIDQGSEATIVSERLAQRLRLPRQRTSVTIIGVGGQRTGVARGRISLRVFSRSGDCEVTATALVLPRLTGYSNPASTTLERWSHLRDPDPDLNSTDPVDILLGADIYPTILLEEVHKGTQNQR